MTRQLVYPRIRNRIVELLEWLIECENEPPRFGMNELINSWEDWVPPLSSKGYFTTQGFTPAESEFLLNVSAAIEDFCEATPNPIEHDDAAIALPQWRLVIAAAKPTLSAMKANTKMSEESDDRLER
ncbi:MULTISPECIES: hypothetical protein [Pseudomonas]|uniref:Uncharacterized protein n=1 Tax=Pseudomonas poae TaxID=200451 RepID=A0ABY0S8J5_9PSED|nr:MULTISPECIES: hypothetical protein [Pseudomonas]KRP41187.1 hypothetical protein TU75_26060 [Pseudomonas poae]NMZ49508.1 hypothetical protein [Pseudomonas poae]CRM23561.1 hypothetical protein [Pseudomonas sp. 24 R 17]SDO91981.1 hypothetical protein SAMN04490208_5424 [Pseudomonas poae]